MLSLTIREQVLVCGLLGLVVLGILLPAAGRSAPVGGPVQKESR